MDREIKLVLNLFMTLGVNFQEERSSCFEYCLKKISGFYFNAYSFYFVVLSAYFVYINGLKDGESLVAFVYFFATTVLRLHLFLKAPRIVELCKYCTISVCVNQSRKAVVILIFFFFNLILSACVSYKEFLTTSNATEALGMYNYLLFEYPVSNENFLILTSILEITRNFIELETPALVAMLLCVLYKKLIERLNQIRSRTENLVAVTDTDPQQLMECCDQLATISDLLKRVNKEMSLPLFYLLLLYILQIMALISIFAGRSPHLVHSIVFLFLVVNVLLSLLIIGSLASKLPGIFSEIKSIIMTSECLKKCIQPGQSETSTIIGLGLILNEIASTFHVTALEAIKIDKTMIITVFCSFITYGVILFQLFENG